MRVALNGLFVGMSVGTGRYTDELVRGSARLETAGQALDWDLLLPAGASTSSIVPRPRGARCRTLAAPPTVRGENLHKLWFEQRAVPAAAAEAELLHYPYFAAPLRSPCRLVVTIHDLIPLMLPEYRGSAAVRMYMQLQVVACRRAALILTDSNASRHDIVRTLTVPRQRVRVIPLGVDGSWRPVSPEETAAVRARHRLPERYIVYMGGLDARKNVERLVLAYARARASRGLTEPLAIAGNPDRGSLYPPLRPLVERLGIEKHVRFLGMVPNADMPALYTGCTLAAYPSRYEGFGLPVLEAMACGAPVACSNASSIPEVAGDDALTFDPDDEEACTEALVRLASDESLRQELRERGRARAATFTWQKTASATLQAYRDALAQ